MTSSEATRPLDADCAHSLPAAMTVICIGDMLREHSSRHGEREAIIHSDVTISYSDFFHRVAALASWLLHRGLNPGAPTAICVRDEVEHLVCTMMLLCFGAPQVNLPSHEPDANKHALAQKIGVTQIIAERVEAWMAPALVFVPPFSGPVQSRVSNESLSALSFSLPRDATPIYQNTSGSTNIPKTIAIPIRRMLNVASRFTKDPSERRVLRTNSVEFEFNALCIESSRYWPAIPVSFRASSISPA